MTSEAPLFKICVERKKFVDALRIVSAVPALNITFGSDGRRTCGNVGNAIGRLTAIGGGKRVDRDFEYLIGSVGDSAKPFAAEFRNLSATLQTLAAATTEFVTLEFFPTRFVASGEIPTFRFVSPGSAPSQFLPIQERDGLHEFSSSLFFDEIFRLASFVSGDSVNYSLNGILIEPEKIEDGRAGTYLVATNGVVMAVSWIDAALDGFLFDAKDRNILGNALKNENLIACSLSDQNAEFVSRDPEKYLKTSVKLTTLGGRYPDWRRSIHVGEPREIRTRFADAVQTARDVAAASVVADDQKTSVLLDGLGCRFESTGKEIGASSVQTPISGYELKGGRAFSFDSKMIKSVFEYLGEGAVDAEFSVQSAKFSAVDPPTNVERFAVICAKQ